MKFSKGFIYRWGQRIKDFGERLGHIKVFGKFVFHDLSGRIISKGLEIKDSVLSCPIKNVA